MIEKFRVFLEQLPAEACLVLNGDTIDNPEKPLPDEHNRALQAIVKESYTRKVIWTYGNHDDSLALRDPGNIQFENSFAINNRLYVSHGFDFDNIMPRNRYFIRFFRLMHRLRILLGAPPVHVAYYAKKWSALYDILRRHVASNAVEHAKENGFEAVVCGHTHYAEDIMIDGIRYINTGAWTEKPVYYLEVNGENMGLKEAGEKEAENS
jgi:UDP-2,3-diacylglucosamine pyrophosphatase LpxH